MRKRDEKPERNRLNNASRKKFSKIPKSKTIVRPTDPEQAREWLRRVADHLSNVVDEGPALRFVTLAIKRYLRYPETRSLQHELKLINSVGNPGSFQTRMTERERGRQVVELKHAGKSWLDIGDAVSLQDKRSVKRLYNKYSELLPKELQQERLDHEMEHFLREWKEERR